MKKIFYSLIVFATAFCSFSSCDDEKETEGIINSHPEESAAGTYTGTFVIVSNSDTSTIDGSVVLSTDTAYICNVAVTVGDNDAVSALANIVQHSNGYDLLNSVKNDIGYAGFEGTISNDGVLALSYYTLVTKGRKQVQTYYNFEGSK